MEGVKERWSRFAPTGEANDDVSELPVGVAGGDNQRICSENAMHGFWITHFEKLIVVLKNEDIKLSIT